MRPVKILEHLNALEFSEIKARYQPKWFRFMGLLVLFLSPAAAATTKVVGRHHSDNQDIIKVPLDVTEGSPYSFSKTQNIGLYSHKSFTTQLYSQDLELHRLISQIPITLDYKYGLPPGVTKQRYEKIFKKIKRMIRENMVYAGNSEVLKKLLRNRLFIQIEPPHVMDSSARADRNGFYVKWDPDYFVQTIRSIVQNEIQHVTVCYINHYQDSCHVLPNSKKFQKEINQGLKKIEKYKNLFNEYLKTRKETPEIKQLFSAVTGYEPLISPIKITPKIHEDNLQAGIAKRLPNGGVHFPGGCRDVDSPGTQCWGEYKKISQTSAIYLYRYNKDGTLISKATAFFIDFDFQINRYKRNPNMFMSQGKDFEVSEQASNIEVLSPGLKKLSFPGYCQLFEELLHVNDYCERPKLG